MASKGAKLARKRAAARGGRPRKANAERYPGGHIKHDWRAKESEQEARSTVIDARMRHWGVTKDTAADQYQGFAFGRFALSGALGNAEDRKAPVNAVLDYMEAAMNFMRVTNPQQPFPKAMNYMATSGISVAPDLAPERAKAIRNRYLSMLEKVKRAGGIEAMDFHDVIFHDREATGRRRQSVLACVFFLQEG